MNKFAQIFKDITTIKALAARTVTADPLQSFMYRVAIDGLPSNVGFQKISGLSREVAVVEYLENMYEHAHKLPGRESVSEVTLERGMFADDYSQRLYENVINNDNIRSTVTIMIMNRFGQIKRKFTLAECWFSKYEVADLDSTSDDVIIETLTMQFEYFL